MDKQKMDYWLSKEPSGNYIRVPLNEAKEIAIKALDKAFNTHFISAYIEEKDAAFIDVDEGLFKRAEQKYEARLKHEKRLNETCRLNNIGIACEKAGDIDGAIAAYEECAKLQYPADHCYNRLRIIYKKRKDFENMKRVMDMHESSFYDEWEEYCHVLYK